MLNMYGVEIPCTVMEIAEGAREFDSGREKIITGTYNKKLFSAVLTAATEIIKGELECSASSGQCWCWNCRQGAGYGDADETEVWYRTGSGHGTYAVAADGTFKVYGSPRSLAGASEYAYLT